MTNRRRAFHCRSNICRKRWRELEFNPAPGGTVTALALSSDGARLSPPAVSALVARLTGALRTPVTIDEVTTRVGVSAFGGVGSAF